MWLWGGSPIGQKLLSGEEEKKNPTRGKKWLSKSTEEGKGLLKRGDFGKKSRGECKGMEGGRKDS